MITYTKNKILAENKDGITKSISIDEVLWAVKSHHWVIAKMKIAWILMEKLKIDKKQALLVEAKWKQILKPFILYNKTWTKKQL